MPEEKEDVKDFFGNWTVQNFKMMVYLITGKTKVMTILKGAPYL